MRLLTSAWRRCAPAAVAALAGIAGAGCCLAPADAEELLSTGFRSPQQTLASFQVYVRADLPTREYLCFSQGFRQRNGLSAFTYGELREELFRRQPWLKLVAQAEIVEQASTGEAEHWVDLRTLGRTVRVKLVREDFYEIHAGEALAAGDDADFERLLRLAADGSGSRVSVRLELTESPESLADASELIVARHWKIDDLRELAEGEPPLAPAAP